MRSGAIVSGESFHGREKEISKIRSLVLRDAGTTQLSVEGLPHVGKSSLVYEALMSQRRKLFEQRVVVAWVNVGSMLHANDVLAQMAEKVRRGVIQAGLETTALTREFDDWKRTGELIALEEYFVQMRDSDVSPVVIFDEFDHVRNLTDIRPEYFQAWRQFAYMPETRVRYVVVSRRPINVLELTCGNSNFANVFERISLKGFSEADMTIIQDEFSAAGREVCEDLVSAWREVIGWSGSHPFLLMNGLARLLDANERVLEDPLEGVDGFGNFCLRFYDEELRPFLEDVGLLDPLLKELFGPIRVGATSKRRLREYGLLPELQGASSSQLRVYLESLARTRTLWELWSQTEIGIRTLVLSTLVREYGDEWVEQVSASSDGIRKRLGRMAERRARGEDLFAEESGSILEYANPRDLFALIFLRWDLFAPSLGKTKGYWEERFELLASVRNAEAHNRSLPLASAQLTIATGYCEEIVGILRGVRVI